MRTSPAASALFLLAALTALLTASTSAASMCDRKPAVQTSSLRVPCAVETHFPIFPFVAPPNTFYPNAYAIASVNGDAFPLDIVYTSTSNAPNYPVLFMASGGPPLFAAPLGIFLVTNLNNTRPTAMAVHDFTGNGQADVVIATEEPSLLFLANDGAGTFTPPGGAALDFGGLLYITDLIAADVDNDGNTDLLLSSATSNAIGWVPHSGGGVFGAYATLHTGAPFSQVELVDIVGNGAPLDIVASAYGTTLLYLPNTGGATFGTPVVIESTASISPRTFAVGDINGDGANDLFALTTPDDTAGFYFNDGSGSFSPRLLLDGGYSAVGNRLASLGDIDNSGTMDIAVTSTPDTVIIYWGLDGVSTFSVPKIVTFETGAAFSNVLLTDLYGNGVLDVVCLAQTSQTVGYIPNLQLVPQFLPVIPFATPSSSIDIAAVAAGDATGDNYPDLFVARGRFIFLYALDPSATAVLNIVKTVDASSSPSGIVTSLAIADLDADGDNDLVATDSIGNIVKVYININGVGDFSDPDLPAAVVAQAPAIAAPTDATLADVDGDGDIDIVVACDSLVGSVVWFANSGTLNPTWSGPHVVNASVDSAHSVRVGDFRRVGAADIVAAYSASILVAYNTAGDGSVWDTHLLTVAPGVRNVLEIGDINLDSTVDVVFLHSSGTLGWFANTGTSFAPTYTTIATYTSAAQHIRVIDTNSNYGLDVAVQIDATSLVVHPLVAAGVFGTPVNVVTGGTNVGAFDVADLEYDHGRDIDVFVRNGDHVGVSKYALHNAFKPVVPTTVTPYTLDFGHLRDSPRSACYRFSNNGGLNVRCILEQSLRGSACVSDTVQLMPGTYRHCAKDRHLRVNHRVVLTPPPGASVTIDCAADGGGVLFEAGITDDATTPADAFGGLVLTNINITGTTVARAAQLGSPGLRAVGKESYIELINVHISNCAAVPIPDTPLVDDGGGACVLARSGAKLLLSASSITSSTVGTGVSGGAIAANGFGSSVCIDTSLLAANSADLEGGGISATASAHVDLRLGSRIVGNRATSGGGVAASNLASIAIDGAVIASNTALVIGGGVYGAIDTRITWSSGSIVANVARQHGGGIWLGSGASLNATAACALASNAAVSAGGGLAVTPPARAVLVGSTVSENMAAIGGAFAALDPATASAVVGVASSADFPDSLIPPPLVPLASVATLTLEAAVLDANHASLFADALVVCGAITHISGAATSWSTGTSILTCLPPGGATAATTSPFVPSTTTATGVPWVSASPDAFAALGSNFLALTPPVTLAVVSPPPSEVMPGVSLTGSFVASDWFGTGTADTRLRLRTELGSGAGAESLEVKGTPTVLIPLGGATSVPPADLRIADTGLLPLSGIELHIGIEDAVGVLIPGLTVAYTVDVVPCAVGFGGLVDGEGFACAPCSGDTFSGTVSLDGCRSCPANSGIVAASNASSTSGCACLPSYVLDATGDCVACPAGARCAGGSAPPVAAPGFFPGPSGVFLACPNAEACTGGGQCRAGYVSRLCAECADGYYALNGKCYKCETGRNTLVVIAILIGVAAVIAALLAFNIMESVSYKFAAAMIGLNGLQISALYGKLELDWSGFADVYFDIASGLNLNFELTSPECAAVPGTDVWVLKYMLTLCLPIFAGAAIAAMAVVFFALGKIGVPGLASKTVGQIVDATKRCWYQVMVLLYMPLTANAFSLFGCRKDATGRWELTAAPARSCYTSSWWALFVFGLFGVVVYALGLPAAVVAGLKRERTRIDELAFALRYGFLVARFEDKAWWFEACIMARKLGVVVCMTFFWADTSKAAMATLFLCATLIHLARFLPYRSTVHNVMAVVVLGAVVLVLYAGTLANKTLRVAGVVVGILVNLLAILIGNALDIKRILSDEKATEENEFYVDGVFNMNSDVVDDVGNGDGTLGSMNGVGLVDMSGGAVAGAQTAGISHAGADQSLSSSVAGIDTSSPCVDSISVLRTGQLDSVSLDSAQSGTSVGPPPPVRPPRPSGGVSVTAASPN